MTDLGKPTHIQLGQPDGSWVDISQYVSNVASHGDEEAAGKTTWGEYLAGLETTTLTLSGDWQGGFTPFGDALFPAGQPVTPVTIVRPAAGHWNRFKCWLKQHHLLPKWVKVRYVTYSFDAALQAREIQDEDGTGFTVEGHAVGPIEKGLEER